MCEKCGGFIAFLGKIATLQMCYCVNCGAHYGYKNASVVDIDVN